MNAFESLVVDSKRRINQEKERETAKEDRTVKAQDKSKEILY